MVTSHVRLVTPAATNGYWRYVLSGEPTSARASPAPGLGLLLKVAVIGPPVGDDVALTVIEGWVKVRLVAEEVPPPGVVTVMARLVALVTRSLARMNAVSWLALTKVVVRFEPLTW